MINSRSDNAYPAAMPSAGSVRRWLIFNAEFMDNSTIVINKSEYNVWSRKDKMTSVLD